MVADGGDGRWLAPLARLERIAAIADILMNTCKKTEFRNKERKKTELKGIITLKMIF